MIETMTNIARKSHENTFLRFSKKHGINNKIVTPTYERQRTPSLKDESDIEYAVYLNSFRLAANTELRKKSSLYSYAALVFAFVFSIYATMELWKHHIPMSSADTVKEAVSNKLIDKLPEGKIKEKLSAYVERKKATDEGLSVKSIAGDAKKSLIEKSGIPSALTKIQSSREKKTDDILKDKENL